MTTDALKQLLWRQAGAALETLEACIRACPDALWGDRNVPGEFWYLAFHTLFYTDVYHSPGDDGFAPPPPFTLSEADPSGAMPPRVYTRDELLDYLAHGRAKTRALIASLTDATMDEVRRFNGREWPLVEWIVYDTRHVQHHAAQLALMLRRHHDDAPRWVGRASTPLPDAP